MRQRRRTYLKEWRNYRHLTQKALAARLEVSEGFVSRLERGERAYTQDLLEAAADALSTDVASLLMRDPSSPDFVWSIWEKIPDNAKPQAQEVLETFAKKTPETEGNHKPSPTRRKTG